MKMRVFIIVNIALFAFCLNNKILAAKFPSDLPQCHASDTNCLPSVMTHVLSKSANGHSGLSIPPLEPLRINSIDIVQGANSPIAINLNLRNSDLSGISRAVVTKVVGFDKNPLNSKYEIHARLPKVELNGDYKIQGKVLVLPIQGNGKSKLGFDNVNIVIKYKPRIITKNGKDYIQTEKFKLDFDTSKLSLLFTNLFNGDKALGDNMNLFLNENWHDILGELKPSITSALEQIFEVIINRIFAKVPYNELFLK